MHRLHAVSHNALDLELDDCSEFRGEPFSHYYMITNIFIKNEHFSLITLPITTLSVCRTTPMPRSPPSPPLATSQSIAPLSLSSNPAFSPRPSLTTRSVPPHPTCCCTKRFPLSDSPSTPFSPSPTPSPISFCALRTSSRMCKTSWTKSPYRRSFCNFSCSRRVAGRSACTRT